MKNRAERIILACRVGTYEIKATVRWMGLKEHVPTGYRLEVQAWQPTAADEGMAPAAGMGRTTMLKHGPQSAEAMAEALERANQRIDELFRQVEYTASTMHLAAMRLNAGTEAWQRMMKEPWSRFVLAYRPTTEEQDGVLLVQREDEGNGETLVSPEWIPGGTLEQIGCWITNHTSQIPILALRRPV